MSSILTNTIPQLLFADHATDFGAGPATAANSLIIGTPTDIQIDLTGLAASGGARQSDKSGDLGVNRPVLYRVDACIEFAASPTNGAIVAFYWAGSPSATAGTGNGGGVTGADSAYTENLGRLGQLDHIGSLTLDGVTVNIGKVGTFVPEHRYGTLIVINESNQAFRSVATAMAETHITFTPIAYGDV